MLNLMEFKLFKSFLHHLIDLTNFKCGLGHKNIKASDAIAFINEVILLLILKFYIYNRKRE